MDTKGGKRRGGGGVMNWAIGIDMYTLMCIKLMTNKDLLYKKINKIKLKNKKKKIWQGAVYFRSPSSEKIMGFGGL